MNMRCVHVCIVYICVCAPVRLHVRLQSSYFVPGYHIGVLFTKGANVKISIFIPGKVASPGLTDAFFQ